MSIQSAKQTLLALSFSSLASATVWAGGGQTGTTERISFTAAGDPISHTCNTPRIPANGRYVAFVTPEALLPEDDNGMTDVYVRDRQTGDLVCASVDAFGNFVDGASSDPSISADGRYVAFETEASNLIAGDTNGFTDIYMRDMLLNTMTRVSTGLFGQPNDSSSNPSISEDGLRVAYDTRASNAFLWDHNNVRDVVVKTIGGGTMLASRTPAGDEGSDSSFNPRISDDGIRVSFESWAEDLSTNDTNATIDIYHADLDTLEVHLVSTTSAGTSGNASAYSHDISPDGRYVAYSTGATDTGLDSSAHTDVYLRDLESQKSWLVSRPDGTQDVANHFSSFPSVGTEAREIAFISAATNLDSAAPSGNTPRMEPIRRELLQDALRLQEELLTEPEGDEAQQYLYALTLRRTAALRGEVGDLEGALESLNEAAQVLDTAMAAGSVAADAALRLDMEIDRGLVDYRRAEMCRFLNRPQASEAYARDATTRFEALFESHPENHEVIWSLARTRNELAGILSKSNKDEASREESEKTARLLSQLEESGSASQVQLRELAKTLQLMAGFPPMASIRIETEGSGPVAPVGNEGKPYLRAAFDLRMRLAEEEPDDLMLAADLAHTAQLLGTAVMNPVQVTEAAEYYEIAHQAYGELHVAFPERPVYTDGVASTSYNLSHVAAIRGESEQREELLRQAVDLYSQLVEQLSSASNCATQLALAKAQLGHACFTASKFDEAETWIRESLELGLPLWQDRHEAGLRASLGWSTGILALVHRRKGEPAAMADAALGYLDLEPSPLEVAWCANFLAAAADDGIRSSLPEDAVEEWVELSLGLLEELADGDTSDPNVRDELTEDEFEVLEEHPRFQAVLEAFGVER